MKKIILIVLGLIIVTGCSTKEVEKNKQVVETNGLLSYTIDGKLASVKPTKEDGYIVNKIICDNGSDLMWDNDNWEVELTEVKSKDRCMVDFTKDINTSGYRVMVTSNDTSSLDSLSKATTENGTVIIYSTSKLKSVSGCNGRVEGNKVIVSNVTENQTCNITIVPTLADTIKISYPPKPGRTDFTKIDNGTPGLYTGTDDQGTTYYFSGDGTNMNNWVRFAGKLWRIIRINGNGSVRLLYAGSGGEDGYIGSVQAYNTGGHPAYVGWKYTTGETLEASRGNKNKSNAYTTVENWYNELNSTDKNYIDLEAIYCNDRDIRSGSYSTSKPFYYTVYRRLAEGRNPVFTCGSTLDRFTTFGLITADEPVYI